VNVKTVVGFYGVYDLLAQWHHDQLTRPRDQIAEKFLGASPMQNRKVYFESSPVSYATIDRNKTAFMLVHGTADDIVDPAQTQQFWQALNQAGIYSRRIVIPGAGHFFASDAHDEPGSFSAMAAPRILRFLQGQGDWRPLTREAFRGRPNTLQNQIAPGFTPGALHDSDNSPVP
jgi:pimeloyl-ACP methyl ester carboxylesterase